MREVGIRAHTHNRTTEDSEHVEKGTELNELTAVEEIGAIVDSHADVFTELSDSIWDNPQLRWTEFDAVSRQVTVAEKYGFQVTRDVAGIPTAFSAESTSHVSVYRLA